MQKTTRVAALVLIAVVMATMAMAAGGQAPVAAKKVLIVTGRSSSEPELKAAEILKSRLLKRSAIQADVAREDQAGAGNADVVFVLGTPESNSLLPKLLQEFQAHLPALPNSQKLHPEGFAVKSGTSNGKKYVLIAGTDPRGVIYGVGCALRSMTFLPDAVTVPAINAAENPAFLLRGGRPSGPGSRARQFGNLRPQTADEMREVMEDLMLLGTNIFEGEPAHVRTYGMMTVFGRTANEMKAGFPKEWKADGGRAERYVCPSVPEARKALLESFDEMFKNAPDFDFFTTNSGDEGGCRCDKCMPWGDKYIALVHDIADILHKYHPNCKVLATNQDLTNEGDQAIYDYLKKGDSSWLYAIRYGPGADEMQTYIRGPVNPRWFEYEGFGPLGNYLKYMHHELPAATNIALYSDITHWMQAQFAVQHPDIALAAVYDRRSWNARPRNFHKVGTEIMHYALGDMHYSEGMHDDFNKWFWYRMLWNPYQDAESLTKEYCRYWLGPEAQDEVAAAIFLMEETLEKPVLDNPGIAKAVDLLHAAGKKIPANLLKNDYRYRIILQKALMDRYIQLELENGRQMKQKAAEILAQAEKSASPASELTKALTILEQPIETTEMKAVMDEALKVGEESNATIGYREPAPFLVAKLDLTEVGWWGKTLKQALVEPNDAKIKNAVRMVLHYDDAGEGGIYDDLGWPNESPHLTNGEALWGFMPFPGPARQSHYNLAYSMGTKEGVALQFDGLDPKAQYVVRFTVGAHIDEERADAVKGLQLAQGLTADGQVVSEGFPVPMGDVVSFEFDIPQSATADGSVHLALIPKTPFFPVTGASEVWLMKKDKMPWTVKPQ